MRNGGFDNTKVFNLDGGLVAWEEEMGVLSN
jgi:rhodanese-related sulfurtransferase